MNLEEIKRNRADPKGYICYPDHDVDWLIAEVERLQAENAELRRQRDALDDAWKEEVNNVGKLRQAIRELLDHFGRSYTAAEVESIASKYMALVRPSMIEIQRIYERDAATMIEIRIGGTVYALPVETVKEFIISFWSKTVEYDTNLALKRIAPRKEK